MHVSVCGENYTLATLCFELSQFFNFVHPKNLNRHVFNKSLGQTALDLANRVAKMNLLKWCLYKKMSFAILQAMWLKHLSRTTAFL